MRARARICAIHQAWAWASGEPDRLPMLYRIPISPIQRQAEQTDYSHGAKASIDARVQESGLQPALIVVGFLQRSAGQDASPTQSSHHA